MADLDDFFAKKDRKKSTKSKKFATTEELAKKYEDTSKKPEVRPPRKQEPVAPILGSDGEIVPQVEQRAEDEWKEFEEEERKDYTGLKISQLQVNDETPQNNGGDGESYDKYDSDGELNVDGEKQKSGPWNKVTDDGTTDATGAVAVAAATTAAAALQERNSASSVYISPAMRNASLTKTTKLRKGVLPDIHNEEYFPVLGSAKPEEVKKKRPEPGFEEVKHGHRVQRATEIATTAPVAIGNRFNSLADS